MGFIVFNKTSWAPENTMYYLPLVRTNCEYVRATPETQLLLTFFLLIKLEMSIMKIN